MLKSSWWELINFPLKLKVAILTDNKQQMCTTDVVIDWSLAHCRLSPCQYAVNTPLIVDESFVLLKRGRRSIETISPEDKGAKLHTNQFCSIYSSLADADPSIKTKSAVSYCVLHKGCWGNITNRSPHFRDTIVHSSSSQCHVDMKSHHNYHLFRWLRLANNMSILHKCGAKCSVFDQLWS